MMTIASAHEHRYTVRLAIPRKLAGAVTGHDEYLECGEAACSSRIPLSAYQPTQDAAGYCPNQACQRYLPNRQSVCPGCGQDTGMDQPPCTAEHPDYPGLACSLAEHGNAGHYALGRSWDTAPSAEQRCADLRAMLASRPGQVPGTTLLDEVTRIASMHVALELQSLGLPVPAPEVTA